MAAKPGLIWKLWINSKINHKWKLVALDNFLFFKFWPKLKQNAKYDQIEKPVKTVLLVRRYKHRKKPFSTTWEISNIFKVPESVARIKSLPDLSTCDEYYLGEFG